MTKKEVINSLPKKVKITQKIIDISDISNLFNCVGANTLRKIFPDQPNQWICWGDIRGNVISDKGWMIKIGTKENVRMTEIIKPQFVTFIITK